MRKTPMLLNPSKDTKQAYIGITTQMMSDFGVKVHVKEGQYEVARGCYQGRHYSIEPDASTASYFAATAALTGSKIVLDGLHRDSLQGDIAFIDILAKMGCHVADEAEGLCVRGPSQLLGVEVDMRECSDTFMTLAAIAPFARSKVIINNIAHARLQESDRIDAIATGLRQLGAKLEEREDGLTIYPSDLKRRNGGQLWRSSHCDVIGSSRT